MAVDAPAPCETDRARAGAGPLASLLSVLQLSDSAFPSGRYTLSYGLESIAQSGHLEQPAESAALIALLADSIQFGVAPSDGVALACAHRAVDPAGSVDLERVARVEERLTAVKLAREPRQASARTGRAVLAAATTALDASGLCEYAERVRRGCLPGNHAVVVGLLSALLNIQALDAVVGELYAFSSGWIAAAVRLGLVDHRIAQGVLHRVRPVIARGALEVANRDASEISSCTPLLDVMAMRHEEAELRLFAT
jgi:urease accessory protein